MWQSIKEYLWEVLHAWAALIVGAVGALVELGFQLLTGKQMPVWGWGVVAALAFVVASVQAFHRVRVERDLYAPEKTSPDWSMGEVYEYLTTDSAASPKLAGHSGWGLYYFSELRQRARDGAIYVWGRLSPGTGILNSTIERIKPDYWTKYQFSHEACTKPDGDHSRTEANFQEGPYEIYEKLRFNQHQIKRLWRPKSPWVRIKKWIAVQVISRLEAWL
jgi:hypothetical protein